MTLAKSKILVNAGFFSEFPEEVDEIEAIVRAGAVGFKLFAAEQVGGVDIDDDQAVIDAFRHVGRLRSLTAVHAEDHATLKKLQDELVHAGLKDIPAFLRAHPEELETKAVERFLSLAKQADMPLHICHLTTEAGLEAVTATKEGGGAVTCEVTPHHLLLTIEDLKRIGTLALTMPPLRTKSQAEALWNGVRSGSIDFLASDHAPHALKEKETELVWDVKVGILGLETILPLLLTEVNRQRLTIGDVVRLMSEKPAEIFRLNCKGSLKQGNDADLTIIDLNNEYRIDAAEFHSKAKYSPFDGRKVKGKPAKTLVGGQLVMDEGEIVAKAGAGAIVRRE
jgi:dihydroorotase (multifunctional complex type)